MSPAVFKTKLISSFAKIVIVIINILSIGVIKKLLFSELVCILGKSNSYFCQNGGHPFR